MSLDPVEDITELGDHLVTAFLWFMSDDTTRLGLLLGILQS
jgi:hypothetical protein